MQKGFTLVELIVVIVIIGILAATGSPHYKGFVLKARQAGAIAYADFVLESAQINMMTVVGQWPTSWSQIGESPSGRPQSCTKYGSFCKGNERVIVNGNYLIGFYSNSNQFRVSAWRFNNQGGTSQNRSVFGCLTKEGNQRIYAWQTDKFYQGPMWAGGVLSDQGTPLRLCN